MDQIKYKKGYKYQLFETYSIRIDVIGYSINEDFIKLSPIGILTIMKGYAWDGPSGPAIDTDTFMRPSLVHDALYQLMRLNYIPKETRAYADKLMKTLCLEDKMWKARACWCYQAVRIGAERFSDESFAKQVLLAPKI